MEIGLKSNIVRQPLLVACLTLALLLAAGLLRLALLPLPAFEAADGQAALLGARLDAWQQLAPRLARWCSGLMLFCAGVSLGRITTRYSLYPVHTYIAIPLYGLFSCGLFMSGHCLVQSTASVLLLLSVRNLFASFRNGYSFDALFRGALYLGLLPLIYTPALPLVVLLPTAIFLFRRSARESIVALFGLLLPFGLFSYVRWACGDAFLAPARRMGEALLSESGFHLLMLPPVRWAQLGLVTLLLIGSLICYVRDLHAMGTRARLFQLFSLLLVLLCGGLFLLPSATVSVAGLAAVPLAILTPAVLTRLSPAASLSIYLLLIVLSLLSVFL